MSAAELPAPQIGRILVAAGLLTEEQLALALEEQAQTGKRLGEIVVQRGFMSGPALANALAEQHGGVLKTEYGFASGLGGVAARRAASESGIPISPLRPPDPTPLPQLRTVDPPSATPGPEHKAEISEAPVEAAEVPPEPTESVTPEPEPTEPVTFEPDPIEVVTPEPHPVRPLLRPAAQPAPEADLEPELDRPEEAPEQPTVAPVSPIEAIALPAAVEPLRPIPQPEEPEPEPELPAAWSPLEPELELRVEAPAVEPVAPFMAPRPVEEAPAPELEPEEEPTPEPEPELPAAWSPPEPELELRVEAPAVEPVASFVAPWAIEQASAPEPEPEPVHEPVLEPEPEPVLSDDRDALIDSLRARVDAQDEEIAALRGQLEQERARDEVQVHVWPEEQPSPEPPAPSQPESHLLCVPTAAGYVLLDREGVLPKVGEPVAVPEQGGNFKVTKVVRLPRNGRPCAYLQRA